MELDKRRLIRMAEAAKAFADRETKASTIELEGENLKMIVNNAEEETKWESSMQVVPAASGRFQVGLNIEYLEKALRGVGSDQAMWKYNDGESPSVFVGENNGDSMNLIMPIRLNKEANDE